MAGHGPAPKAANLRQRTNKKSGASVLHFDGNESARAVPPLPNHDLREWHAFTVIEWQRWWQSPMAGEWLPSDQGGLYMLAILHDEFFKTGDVEIMKEIRLQRPCFGLTPIDRSRLQWEIVRGVDAEGRKPLKREPSDRKVSGDPRAVLLQMPTPRKKRR